MTVYILGIGSNINAESQCRHMIAALELRFGEVKVSELVMTKAVGLEAPDYMNGVVCFESEMSAEALQQWCKMLEDQLGRDRKQSLCAADIDLLLTVNTLGGFLIEELVNKVEEPWFRPLVAELLHNL